MALGLAAALPGLISKGLEFINKRWPANMSEADRRAAELVVSDMLHNQQVELIGLANEQDAAFNQRIKDLEGTAQDLKGIPVLGTIVIFARGMFRPVFSYFTMYLDVLWFVQDTSQYTQQQNTALFVINIIVLTFFFGERAIKNLLPAIAQAFGTGATK